MLRDSHVFQPHLERASPIWGYLTCLARHGDDDQVPSWIKKSIFSKRPDMSFIAREFAKTSAANRYLVQTSKAPTIFNAGLKVYELNPLFNPLISKMARAMH